MTNAVFLSVLLGAEQRMSLFFADSMCGVSIYPRSPDSEPRVTIFTILGLHVFFRHRGMQNADALFMFCIAGNLPVLPTTSY
jgi:hypothetical protein